MNPTCTPSEALRLVWLAYALRSVCARLASDGAVVPSHALNKAECIAQDLNTMNLRMERGIRFWDTGMSRQVDCRTRSCLVLVGFCNPRQEEPTRKTPGLLRSSTGRGATCQGDAKHSPGRLERTSRCDRMLFQCNLAAWYTLSCGSWNTTAGPHSLSRK